MHRGFFRCDFCRGPFILKHSGKLIELPEETIAVCFVCYAKFKAEAGSK